MGCTSPVESGTLSLCREGILFSGPFGGSCVERPGGKHSATLGDQHGERSHSQVGGRGQWTVVRDWNPRGKEVAELVVAALRTCQPLPPCCHLQGLWSGLQETHWGEWRRWWPHRPRVLRLLTTPHFTSEEIGSEGLEGDMGLAAIHSGLQRQAFLPIQFSGK